MKRGSTRFLKVILILIGTPVALSIIYSGAKIEEVLGIFTIGMMVIFASMVVAVFATVLQNLL